jgi:hypothetical protein
MRVHPVEFHIESLVLEGVRLDPRHAGSFRAAFEGELTRLLCERALRPSSGGASRSEAGPPIRIGPDPHPVALGREVARSVYSTLERAS